MHVRRALDREAEELSALAMAAKAHWGYAEKQLEAWHPVLEITAASVLAHPTFVGELDGRVIGFYSLVPTPREWDLDHMWVHPEFSGRGYGRTLLSHAAQTAADGGATGIGIDADPNAESFYLACGAKRIGEVAAPIPGQPNRVRPQLLLAGPDRGISSSP